MNIKVKLTLKGNQQYLGQQAGAVVTIPFEDYVKGVVAAEIGNAPIEACKAQAVASRTFAYLSARDGIIITDTGASDQAFVAARMTNRASYANAIQAVEETIGQVLTYQGKHIGKNAHYSSANNGSTKNKRYKWPSGSDQPYLVLRPDQWTYQELQRRQEFGERIRYGHGVGLSQYGAIYAAGKGIGYQEILDFYYPGTIISTTGQSTGGDPMSNTRAQRLIELAQKEVGGAYVFVALGEKCTPGNRSTYANRKPAHAEAIKRACQVLNGSRPSCVGCRYNGKRIFDCRGFTSVMLKEATGRYLKGSGATSQWNDLSNWAERGPLSTIPDKPCVLFSRSKSNPNVMSHTGLYIGNYVVIQSGGYGGTGVHVGPLRENCWTDWAVPVLLYDTNVQTGGETMTLSKGASGEPVRQLQAALTKLNYAFKPTKTDPMGIDGIFGADTENKVRLFQINHGLIADGIWKETDQAKLEALLEDMRPPSTSASQNNEPNTDKDVTITLPLECAKAIKEALKGVV